MNQDYYDSEYGILLIQEDNNAIYALNLIKDPIDPHEFIMNESKLIKEAKKQLDEYFKGTRKSFDLPLALNGTAFQIKVWQALMHIPYGETRCYEQIAAIVGCPKGCRAVGMANHHNPIPIIIPCHRVIQKNHTLGGYAYGLAMKKRLLQKEIENSK